MARHFIIGTAGHIDHGKSSLVKALTGTDPDRLPEEKARGITIDLGFASLNLPEADCQVGIIDVPGHEDFVKNMVAGVGSIDLALFVIAADDGWMPQTEEHLQILTYLGVDRAVVALTKVDLGGVDSSSAEESIRDHLAGTTLANAPIIKTSVITGQGIAELKDALSAQFSSMSPAPDIGKPRLPVDRVFSLRGIGTVVTGTLTGGTFQRGQAVEIQPGNRPARIRSLQSHNRDVERAVPGTRTAINLPDIVSGKAGTEQGIARGDVVTLAGLGAPSAAVDVLLEKSGRLAGEDSSAARPIKDGALVRVHYGTANSPARIILLDAGSLAPGGKALAQLRFEAPVFLCAGDRFIVRDWSEQTTLAGGIVLEPDAPKRNTRSVSHLEFLRQRAECPNSAEAFVRSQLARDHAVPLADLLTKSRFSASQIESAAKGGVTLERWIVDPQWWTDLRNRAASLIQVEHQSHPERGGLALNDLRRSLQKDLPEPAFFDIIVRELCRTDFVQTGAEIRHRAHRPALPAALQAVGTRIRNAMAAKPFEPPPKKELAPDITAQKALRFMIETGEAIDLSEDSAILADAFNRAVDSVKKHLRERGPATASDLRQLLGTNRRVIIPLLEKLDREGITTRQGDKRILKSSSR